MKRIINSALILLLFGVVYAQNDLQPLATIRITKSEPITVRQLKLRTEAVLKQNGLPSLTVAQKKEVLEELINEKLLVQAAEKARMSVTDTQVNQTYIQFISNQIGKAVTEQEFAAIVREQQKVSADDFMREQTGMSIAELKSFIKTDLIVQQYVASLKGAELSAAMPTDAEIRAQFEVSKAQLVQPEMLQIFAVNVPKLANPEAARQKANSLYNDLANKKMSISEAKIKSQAPDSGFQAGEGYVSLNPASAQQLGFTPQELTVYFSKNPGTYSEIKEGTVAYQFYCIMEKFPQKFLGLSDLVQPGTTVTVYEYLKNGLAQAKQMQVFNGLKQTLASSLRTSENFKMEKTGDALDKLLTW